MNVLLIDFFNIVKRYTFLLEEIPDEGEFYSDIAGKVVNRICKIVDDYRIDFIVVCSDLGFNRRANSILSGEYKATRNRAKSLTQEEKEKDYINKLKEIVKSFPCIFLEVQDVEADNLIYFAINYISKSTDCNFYIASSDTDFLQLIDSNTSILNWNKGLVNLDNWKEIHKFNCKDFKPKDYAILKAIVGDSSDNIKGLKGIGWTSILKLMSLVYSKLGKDLEINNIMNFIGYLNELLTEYTLDKKEQKLVSKMLGLVEENKSKLSDNYSIIALDLLETPYIVKIMNSLESATNTPIQFNSKDFLAKIKLKERFESDKYYQEILNKNLKLVYNIKRLAAKMEKSRQSLVGKG